MSIGSTLLLSSFPFIWHSKWSLYLPHCVPLLSLPENWHNSEWSHFSFQGNLLLYLGQAKGAINNSCQHHLALTLSGERLLWGKTWEKPPVSLFERASGYVKSTPLFDNFGAAAVVNSSLSCSPSSSTIWFSSSFILFMLFIHAFQCLSFVSWPVLPSVLFSG